MSSDMTALACTVCFGAADGGLLTAARLGVLVMLGLTVGVLTAFALFFLRLRKGDSPLYIGRLKGDCPLFTKNES